MSPPVQVMLSSALTFGVPLVLALRELLALSRRRPRSAPDDGPDPRRPPPRPDAPRRPALPACLIPVRHPMESWPPAAPDPAPRGKVLEPA